VTEGLPPGVRPYGDGAIPEFGYPDRRFGAHFNAEMALIRSMLLSYGLEADYMTLQSVRERSYSRHETFAEYQKRVLDKKIVRAPPSGFTKEELAFMIEHFEGANDPLVQSILEKARLQHGRF
jgi:hypothetical protein